ncbi:MAG: DUF3276 family protein [Bacteroidaceae bacterium]|nr:DUF3276 family protein [Bacteroidaceae bacterium]
MDYKRKDEHFDRERDIVFTQAVRAGKRIYYLDVKRGKNDDLFLSITESKKIAVEGGEGAQFNFEKHKIFLYKEDFSKFITALSNAIRFIHEQQPAEDDEAETPLPDVAETLPEAPAEPDESPAPEESAADDELTLKEEIDLKIDF